MVPDIYQAFVGFQVPLCLVSMYLDTFVIKAPSGTVEFNMNKFTEMWANSYNNIEE